MEIREASEDRVTATLKWLDQAAMAFAYDDDDDDHDPLNIVQGWVYVQVSTA